MRYLRYIFLGLLLFIFFVLIINVKTFMSLGEIYKDALSARNNLNQAIDSVKANDFDSAEQNALSARDDFGSIYEQLEKIDDNFFVKRLPGLSEQLKDFAYIAKTAEVLSRSLAQGTSIAAKVNQVVSGQTAANFSEFKPEEKKEILKLIYESGPELNGIKANLNLSLMNLERVKARGFLFPFKGKIYELKEQLILGTDLMSKSLVISELLPILAGYPDQSHYLVMLQNSDELRPTGGFIGTLGVLDVYLGDLVSFRTNDVYHLDMPASLDSKFVISPPWQMKKYLGVDRWYLRDSNWSPDWPTSAKKIEWFYQEEAKRNNDEAIKNAPQFDGLIAITPRLITDLLYLVGPIQAGGQEYNKDNFMELLQYEVEMGYRDKGTSEWDRKKVIGDILKELKNRLFDLPSEKYLELLSTLNENIEKKNILVYFNDQKSQELAEDLNWGGEIKETNGDFFMVVDANMAAFKTDRVMNKEISYEIEEKDDGLYATAILGYQHTGGYDWKTTKYRSYVRVYAPLGSEFISVEGAEPDSSENKEDLFLNGRSNKQSFGAFLQIDPGKSKYLKFKYKLPATIKNSLKDGSYNLYISKQAGNNISKFSFKAKFKEDINLSSSELEKLSDNQATWSGVLEKDKEFFISFK